MDFYIPLLKWVLSILGSPYLTNVPIRLQLANSITSFLIYGRRGLQVHYTSHVNGISSMHLSETARKSLAVSGACNIVAFKGTSLSIGEKTIFANNVCIRTGNHEPFDRNAMIYDDVFIGKNCWLGHGVVITPGVSIGDNVTIAANAVVTKPIPPNCLVGGVPAKIIKFYDGRSSAN